ncbi:hypothetical protein [Rhizobium leguminosarum]|uniref:hypothetical protein n=1 Tax=Rhizobium leguminosarum TaxID=384 RepID=UPI00041F564C|nr:hypothetical protein [Rhizobium leguminosarum]
MAISLNDVQRGYERWAAKPHNAKWVRKIDHTPIANDIVVNIFEALKDDPAISAKGLVWVEHRDSFPAPHWSALTPFGFYDIEEISASDGPAYEVRLHAHHLIAITDGLDEAKAAAQSDYERRILSALTLKDDPGNGGDGGAERLREALTEAEETLRLVEHPAFPDPEYHQQVKDLGNRIGFGALMSTASAAWREILAEKGYPIGGEFVAGPCHGTVVDTLAKIRAALSQHRKRSEADGK